MITKCAYHDVDRILNYIGPEYPRCLYLYLDLKQYGFQSDTVIAYIQHSYGKIESVLLKYHTCLHVFSKDNDFNAEELASFFYENGFSMIYSTKTIANAIFSALPLNIANRVEVTNGWVARIKNVDNEPEWIAVSAEDGDFAQIVDLIYEDEDIGKSYDYEDLAKQIAERNREGYARNLVIKQDDLVIAHACTNAEFENIAVVAELIVRKSYRRNGYASEIWREICSLLLAEGKEVYSFYYSEESRRLHKKIGFFEVCEWSKIVMT